MTFDKKLNMDTATPEKIASTNNELVDYMRDIGEDNAADTIRNIMDSEAPKPVKNNNSNNLELLRVDKKILKTLERIQRDMFDEQDTSIKRVSAFNSDSVNGFIDKSQDTQLTKDDDYTGSGSSSLGLDLFVSKKNAEKKKKKQQDKKKKRQARKVSRRAKIMGARVAIQQASKASSKALGKGALRLAKFTGPIGVALTAGMAVYDGVNGWDDAEKQLDMNGDATTSQKAAAAAGGVISGLTFGLLDSKDTSQGINNLFGGNDTIKKYEKLGIIDHDTFGDSEIVDWIKVTKLTAGEIQEIISINDFSQEDTTRLNMLKVGANAAQQVSSDHRSDESQQVEKIDYKIKTVHVNTSVGAPVRSSVNPDDYKPSELFRLNGIKDSDFDGLEPNTLSNLKAMGAEYADTYGKKIQVNSAFRSIEEQQKLKDTLGSKAAAPGKSMHNYGLAVDINTTDADAAEYSGLFDKYKFTRPVRGETWHVEPKGIDRAAIRANPVQTYNKVETNTNKRDSEGAPETVTRVPEVSKPVSELLKAPVSDTAQETVAGVNKIQRENIVNESTKNLTTQTTQSTTRLDPTEVAQVIAPMINNNINIPKEQKNDRPLSMF